MPPPWGPDRSGDDRAAVDGWSRGWPGGGEGWPGAGIPRAVRLWLPVIVSFFVQVPAVAFLVGRSHDYRGGGFFPVVLALVGPVALLWARRFPGPVTAVTALAAAALLLLRPDIGTPYIALGFAIILGIIRGARVWVYSSVGAVWVATIVAAIVLDVTVQPWRVASTTLGLAIALAIGEGLRTRRERYREYRRAADARRQTAEQRERMRIARELHDVLAHSLSQINVQAGVGLHLIDSQPEKAAEALANIKGASKNALDEVRAVLGILRSDPGEGPVDDVASAPLVPEPDLSRLPALVESFAAQGLRVELVTELEGAPTAPAATQLALYRICQEALTNVLRHAQARTATVRVGVAGGAYVLTVRDDGASAATGRPVEPGGGLLGMQERAELLGGSFRAGWAENGGFEVEARIPLPGSDRPGPDREEKRDA
jgi:signal transduction histidine kinase